MLRLGEGLYLELVGQLQGGVVERDVIFENLGHRRLFEDRLPRALGLARAAVDTLVGLNIYSMLGKRCLSSPTYS